MADSRFAVGVERVAHEEKKLAEAFFPSGVERRLFNLEACERLFREECVWNPSPAQFLKDALTDGRMSTPRIFADLRTLAEDSYQRMHPGETFELQRFNDFLHDAFEAGLLTKNLRAPDGNLRGTARYAFYELSTEGLYFLRPRVTENDQFVLHEEVIPFRSEFFPTADVLRYVRDNAPAEKDLVFEDLSARISSIEIDTAYTEFTALISNLIKRGMLSEGEDDLGTIMLQLTTDGRLELESAVGANSRHPNVSIR